MQKTFLYILLIYSQVLFSSTQAIAQASYIITTVAGNGIEGYCCDDAPATIAEMDGPIGVAIDNKGNLYIGDKYNSRIRKVDASGIITTIVGSSIGGFGGDGGQATAAKLASPYGVFVDVIGNIFIADNGNNRIRKVDTSGIITTIAGTGFGGYNGDNIAATLAEIFSPGCIVKDDFGNLYFTDGNNYRIRKIDTNGIISTFAGNGLYGLTGDNGVATDAAIGLPYGITIDKQNNIYVSQQGGSAVREINTSGIITTIAGTGDSCNYNGDLILGKTAHLCAPGGLAFDNNGNLFICDYNNRRLRFLDTSGFIHTYAGTGSIAYNGDEIPATNADVNPGCVAIDNNGNIYFSDFNNNRIRLIKNPLKLNYIQDQKFILQIYPNPNDGNIIITVSSNIDEQVKIDITNLLGEKMKAYTLTTNIAMSYKLDVPVGMYFITATTSTECYSTKIIITK